MRLHSNGYLKCNRLYLGPFNKEDENTILLR